MRVGQAYIIYVTTLPNFCRAEKNGHQTGTERNEGKKRQRRENEKEKRDESWKKKKRQKPLCEREA